MTINKFINMSLDGKKKFFTNAETLREWNSLKGGREIKLQRGSKGRVLGGFKIFGWEHAVMLKFKYFSKNGRKIKNKNEFWDSVIWHVNEELSDTDILDPNKYDFEKPFRILTKAESKTAGQSKMVRAIEAEKRKEEEEGKCNKELKAAKKRKCGKFRSWNKDPLCKTPACDNKKQERYDFIREGGKNVTVKQGEQAAATAIQSVARGRSVRNDAKSKAPESQDDSEELLKPIRRCVGKSKNCEKTAAQNHSGVCMSYGCTWEGPLSSKKRKGGRKKKKRRKAFPSRRKNNRKNRTKKKALSK